jgi:hypothetical protein
MCDFPEKNMYRAVKSLYDSEFKIPK